MRPGEPGGPAAPQPGLSGLDELVEPLRGVGLAVALRREGAVHPLPAGVDLSAYRIVQEALTNTLRHGRATRAEVTVRYGADSVELDVRDDGLAQSGRRRELGRGAWSGCASGRRCWAARSRRARSPRAAIVSMLASPWRPRVSVAWSSPTIRRWCEAASP